MSLTGVIGSFKTHTDLLVTRRGDGSYTDGLFVEGAESTFPIDAVITPVTGKELRQLPEAYHQMSVYTVITETQLKAQDTTTQSEGDRMTIAGLEHTVFKVEDWGAFGESFYQAIVTAEPV